METLSPWWAAVLVQLLTEYGKTFTDNSEEIPGILKNGIEVVKAVQPDWNDAKKRESG